MPCICGKCGTDLGDPVGVKSYLLCPRCCFGAMPQEHTQERDRRINEAALAMIISNWGCDAITEAERLIAAQDAAAQARP